MVEEDVSFERTAGVLDVASPWREGAGEDAEGMGWREVGIFFPLRGPTPPAAFEVFPGMLMMFSLSLAGDIDCLCLGLSATPVFR